MFLHTSSLHLLNYYGCGVYMIITLGSYNDDRGNTIIYGGEHKDSVKVTFSGLNNTLTVSDYTQLNNATILFDCDNGVCNIGNNKFIGSIRIGQDCYVNIADKVSCTNSCIITTAEGASVFIGEDCMIASVVEIRADDAHPIFNVKTGLRVNRSRDIIIGEHVWLAGRSTILSGGQIGSGSVLGYGSILKSKIPNNCIAVGIPAKVSKRNIAWERPHLSMTTPFYKPDKESIAITKKYWKRTITSK